MARILYGVCALLTALLAVVPARAQGNDLWQSLAKGGHVALMRHALAPGTGDPKNFRIGDCTTQRNLNEEGRAQARRTGARFRQNGVTNVRAYASLWCRSHETAELLGLGSVQALPMLNSLHGRRQNAESQTAALRRFIAGMAPDEPSRILVSHQATIHELTGVFTTSGGIVVVRPDGDGFQVLGTLPAR